MSRRIILRIAAYMLSFIAITFLVFLLVYLAPGDAVDKMLAGSPVSAELKDSYRATLGLDRSVFAQYADWLLSALQGDLGTSFRTNKPVMVMLLPALGRTIILAGRAFLLTVVISLVAGVLCARYKDKAFDHVMRWITYIFYALPSFVVGILALYVFALKLKWFPVSATAYDFEWGLVLPVTVLALSMSAWMIRQVRTIVLERMSEPYVVGLKALGISRNHIEFVYVLKHALVPIITDFGIILGSLMGGAVLVETVFSWPGVGQILMTAISNLDYPVIQGFALWIAIVYFLINVGIDVLCGLADPRIVRGGRGRTGGPGGGRGIGRNRKRIAEQGLAQVDSGDDTAVLQLQEAGGANA